MTQAARGTSSRLDSRTPFFSALIILLAYLLIGVLYAGETPAWQAPDEPAHYNYVRQLAEGTLPVIEPSDYDERYRSEAVSSGFSADYPIEPITYEDWQPPLYYLLLTPLFLSFDGALLPLRLASLVLGAGTVLVTFTLARFLWPHKYWAALVATTFVALLPQHVAILSSVNNDSLATLIVALVLWALTRAISGKHLEIRVKSSNWILIGLLLGLGFLTKLTVYIMAPVILIAGLHLYWNQWSSLLRALLAVSIPAGVLGALWWVRNLLVYEGFDPLAMEAHDAVVVGQPRTVEWLSTFGAAETLQRFGETTFRSFWGQFGWMGVLMDARVYQALFLFTALVIGGLILRMIIKPVQAGDGDNHRQDRRILVRLLWLTFLLNLALYLAYNITFVQHQGRYLFVALIPIAIAVAAGIDAWLGWLLQRRPALTPLVPLFFAMALFALDLIALYRYIVPQLATR